MTDPVLSLLSDGRARFYREIVAALPDMGALAVYSRLRSLHNVGLLLRLPAPLAKRHRPAKTGRIRRAKHPRRVSRLYLWCVDPNARQIISPSQ